MSFEYRETTRKDARDVILQDLILRQKFYALPDTIATTKRESVLPVTERIWVVPLPKPDAYGRCGILFVKTWQPRHAGAYTQPKRVRTTLQLYLTFLFLNLLAIALL